jgi:hypothetical protein
MTFSSNQPLNTNQLPISFDVSPEDKEFDVTLIQYVRRIANAVNTKESGLFLLQENASFEQWFQTGNPQQNRNGYRITVDLVAINGGNIPAGATNIVLTSSTQPQLIDGYLYPVQGFGGALDTTGISYFLNDPDIYVRYNDSTNTITIQNNSGNDLTWCVWVMEYLKT